MRVIIFFLATIFLISDIYADDTKNDSITIILVGDLMLAETPGKLIRAGGDPFIHFAPLLLHADMTIGNLECVIATQGTAEDKPYTFRAPTQALPILKKYFTALSLANNHSGDFGKKAFIQMLDLLNLHQISYFGGGYNLRDSHKPLIKEIKGKRIGVLGYDGFFPRNFEALPEIPGVAWLDEEHVVAGIKQAKQKLGVDFLIVYPHWGWERNKIASDRQRRMAHLMIDSGADIIVGSHPHVTQDIEIYQDKFIFYSLGNFVFDGFRDDLQNTGWLLQLTLKNNYSIEWRIIEARINKKGIPRVGKQIDYDIDE